ncbi:MAG: hypothetical protein RXP97_05290 [Nitrososphaeria archaeon]
MKAVIIGYRRGPGKIYQGISLVRALGWDGSSDLTGWTVVARDRHGNVYEGRVLGRYGRGNVLRVRFSRNIPGQMLGVPADLSPATS